MVPSQKIQDLLKFVAFTQEFQKVKRVILKKDSEEWESDADHSWQLAIVAWYIIEQEKLHFDLRKVITYSLVHDLVEVYAGDTFAHGSESDRASKQQREEEALRKIEEQFPECLEMISHIHHYEAKEDPESKFVYALDKLLPVVDIYLDNGRIWKREKITYEMVREVKDQKISISQEIENYWKDVCILLEENKEKVLTK